MSTHLYFAADIVALTSSVLLGAAVLISYPRSFNARIFALILLSTSCYLIGRMSYAFDGYHISFGYLWPVLLILMNSGTGFWMILSHSLFEDTQRTPRSLIVAFGIQISLSAINALSYRGPESLLRSDAFPGFVNILFGPVPLLMQSVFASIAIFWVLRGWRSDVVESRRILRWLFLGLLAFVYFGVNVTEMFLMPLRPLERVPFDNAMTLALAAIHFVLVLICVRFDGNVLDRVVDRVVGRVVRTDVADASGTLDLDLNKFRKTFVDGKVYLEAGLSIAALADRLSIPQYRLRALVNKRLGYRNFNSLLHDYRLKEACAMLADPEQDHLPILTIALTVGYQSIAPFNQAFRDQTGMTPSAYREDAQRLAAHNAWQEP